MFSCWEKFTRYFHKKDNTEQKSETNQLSKSGKHICCVCKETKDARDLCITKNGQEQCKEFIEAHNKCLRDEGFTVEDK